MVRRGEAGACCGCRGVGSGGGGKVEQRGGGGEAAVAAAVRDLVHEGVVVQALHLLLGVAPVIVLVGAPVVAPVGYTMDAV